MTSTRPNNLNGKESERLRLAKALGWTDIRLGYIGPPSGIPPGQTKTRPEAISLPDWWNDLNAAAQLGDEMQRRGLQTEWLATVCIRLALANKGTDSTFAILQCPAAIRADAALAVLEGK